MKQSIVDQPAVTGGTPPTFTYGNTAMSGWLCRTVSQGTANNSSPEGELFYYQVGLNTPQHYAVYSVDQCPGAEAVGGGNVPGYQPQIFNGNIHGTDAITDDMVGYSNGTNVIGAKCVIRH